MMKKQEATAREDRGRGLKREAVLTKRKRSDREEVNCRER
jgi:hypothetical protein